MWLNILGPSTVYAVLWVVTAFLINIKLTSNIIGFSGYTTFVVYVTCFNAVLIALAFKVYFYKVKNKAIFISIKKAIYIKLQADRIYCIWIVLVVINTIYAGGIPLISVLMGNVSGYSDVGIPSLKGLSHTLYLFSATLYGCLVVYKPENIKISKIIIFIIIIYPVLILARGLFVYLLLQFILCYLYSKRINYRGCIKLIIFAVIFIVGFGILGDVRGEYSNPLSYLVVGGDDSILGSLPSGFTWLYIYITANFNNIILTHGTFSPSYSFVEILYNIVPGALKSIIFDRPNTDFSPILTDDNLNVASIYAGYISGFGVEGAIVGGTFIILISNIFFTICRVNNNIGYLAGYSVIFSCIVLSIFFDAFLTISTIFQLVMCMLLAGKLKSIN